MRTSVRQSGKESASNLPRPSAIGILRQRAIGDQPARVQTPVSFAYDFSRIPLHAPGPKLLVSAPGNVYEQEANRVAADVMRAPAPKSRDHKHLRTKPAAPGSVGEIAAPALVDEVLRSPGRPLEPATRAFMEPRFGHDFSRVRIHTGNREAESAEVINARAYAVGHDVVFGAGQYAPGTIEGRRLITHELAHVTQASGVPFVQRDVKFDRAHSPTDFEFRVGTELEQSFVQLAKQLAEKGPIGDPELRQLRKNALDRSETVNDSERMFMAGLSVAANVKTLKATAIGKTTSITFSLASITNANVQHVIDLDREKIPANIAKQSDASITDQIKARAGSFKTEADALIQFATENKISLALVLEAMLAAASDNSEGDRVFAGIVFVIAKSSGNPMSDDLLNGKIKVDALTPSAYGKLPAIARKGTQTVAFYVTAAQSEGSKGDTIYLQTSIDITNLKDRSDVIHELRHAEQDKAGPATGPPGTPLQQDLELDAYKAQARYILEQMIAQSATAQQTSAQKVGPDIFEALVLVAQTDVTRFQAPTELVFAATPAGRSKTPAEVRQKVKEILAMPAKALENAVLEDIRRVKGLKSDDKGVVEGLEGESLIHWIHRK